MLDNNTMLTHPQAIAAKIAIIKEMIAQDEYVIHPDHIVDQWFQNTLCDIYAVV